MLFIIAFFFTLSLFIAPFTLEPHSLKHLDGKANWIDYRDNWDAMPLFPRVVYYIGDFNCHQMYDRSFTLNGNQMPMCSRDIGIFIGMNIGFFIALFITPTASIVSTAVQFFPKKIRAVNRKKTLLILTATAMITPAVIDGFLQLLTPYESSNFIRFDTGMPLGIVIAGFIAAVILSLLAQNTGSK
jgi:uncharacterized membrane protein